MKSLSFLQYALAGFSLLAFFVLPGTVWSKDEIEGLGRLFIDSDQREKLEAVRRGTYKAETEKDNRVSNVRVNGVRMRSNGENVIWINDQNTLNGAVIEGVYVNPNTADIETLSVPLRVEGKLVHIKPGQNWSEGTGTVKDNY